MNINVALLALALITAITGLFDKVSDEEGRPFYKRLKLPGWVFILGVVSTFCLGYYKDTNSFEGHLRKVYPNFEAIVERDTNLPLIEWTKYMSYRVTLRFSVQRLYTILEGDPPEPSQSVRGLMENLGKRGALSDDLCRQLDFVRFNTFRAEWGIGDGGSSTQLEGVDSCAHQALLDLQKIVDTIAENRLTPNPSTVCGVDPPKTLEKCPAR